MTQRTNINSIPPVSLSNNSASFGNEVSKCGRHDNSNLVLGTLSSNVSNSRQINSGHITGSNHNTTPGNNPNGMDNNPVPIVHMSAETLKQIQDDLLQTVSESDLNAVLNATPDSSDPSILANNATDVFFPDNTTVQFSDSTLINSESYERQPHLGNSNTIQQHYNSNSTNNSSIPILDNNDSSRSVNTPVHFDRSQSNNTQLNLSDFDKLAQTSNDELANAINSITQHSGNNTNSNACFDSPMSGFLQHVSQNSGLQQGQISQVMSPTPSPSSSIASSSATMNSTNTGIGTSSASVVNAVIGTSSTASSLNVASSNVVPLTPSTPANSNVMQDMATLGQSVVTSQGITVVIGGTATPIALPSQSPSLTSNATTPNAKKNSSILTTHGIIQQQQHQQNSISVGQSPLHSNSSNVNQQHFSSTSQNTMVTPPHTTPSPKKSNKKKKPGEPRKVVPLKDREYNPEIHCGVVVPETGKPCTRSLTCKTHSLSLRRAVNSRSKKFDDLLLEHKANKEAITKAAKPPEAAHTLIQVSWMFTFCLYFFR